MNRIRAFAAVGLLLAGTATSAAAAGDELWPGAQHDPSIPTLAEVVGHAPGEEITSPEGITTYLRALARAAPGRTRLVEYARSWEGRPLHLLVIGSPERIAGLDTIKADLRRFADPRGLAADEVEALIGRLPVVTWLVHAVHGNEISSSDAALALAYHLLASQGDTAVDAILRESLVLIDPLENPDGRARFLAQNLLGQAAQPDAEPASAEHDEPWPGGRSNHYLFDMNRDWFALTQPETRGRIAVALEYFPQVVVDLHEMGGDSTYYFAPPATPDNPHVTAAQKRWFETFGRANAASFDERGFRYFVREIFDSFYPGYGESWPFFQGAIGMTFEQASARGLLFRRSDETLLTYGQGVLHHFTAAMTTARTAAANRAAILRDYFEYRQSAVAEGAAGARGAAREYLLAPGVDASRAERLARLLVAQGVEVREAAEKLAVGTRTFPAGTFVVSAAQPAGRLVRNLLEPNTTLDPTFVAEQERRRKAHLPDQIYDVTAWSLPALFDVECVLSPSAVTGRTMPVTADATARSPQLAPARVGYLVPWGSSAAAMVNAALAAGLKAQVAGEPFTLGGRRFGIGTVLFRGADNGADLPARLGELAARHGVAAVAIDSTWVDQGMSLGSNEMRALRVPRVLLAWDRPAQSLSAGWARYLLERRFGVAVTAVRTSSLGRIDLTHYDAMVLPSGDYSEALSESARNRLRAWIEAGGTLVTLGDASRWAAEGGAGLLATTTELKGGAAEKKEDETSADKGAEKSASAAKEGEAFDYEKAIQPERERPDATSGAILRVELDPTHWLSAGNDNEIQVMVEGQRIFTPIKLDKGRNVGTYAPSERLVASGLVWPEVQKQLARKAYLIDQPIGAGHLIAFAEDPNYRGYAEGTALLWLNALMLGPAF